MKIPKKAKKCEDIINNMVNLLGYYMSGSNEFRRMVREDVQFLETYLQTISEDHKVHNIRFATKLKGLWKKEMMKKECKIKELESEIKDMK